MEIVIIPIVLLLTMILFKKIPYIHGDIRIACSITAFSALMLGGLFSPIEWINALINGIDRFSWVIGLSIFGSIYGESQVALGTMDTVLNGLRARFGHSPKGLVICVIMALVIAGSLLGDAIACATVIGVLTITSLRELKLTGEQISATILMGAALGSLMPPITQTFFLSSSIMGLKSPDPVLNVAYFTIGIGVIICSFYVAKWFIKIKALPEELIPKETLGQIVAKNWYTLIPLTVLALIVVLRSGFNVEVLSLLNPIFDHIKNVKIVKGINFAIVKALIVVTIISYFFKPVRDKGFGVIKRGLSNVWLTVGIQVTAAFMIGAFYAAGQIKVVEVFAKGLSEHVLKLGGSAALILIGMLTGSQTTAQTTVFTFFGPALKAIGLDPVRISLAGGHLAAAGQGLPPVDLATFVVAGLVGGILGIKVDPVRSMFYSSVMCIYLAIVGVIFLYI